MAAVKKAIFAVGRRKTSVARVKLTAGTGKITINGREPEKYFTIARHLSSAMAGLEVAQLTGKYDLQVLCHGGGLTGQAGALRMGLARAIQKDDPSFHVDLKKAGLLRRDPRMVERKKYGLRKARRGTQFSKR